MGNETKSNKDQQARQRPRTAYVAPSLREFGPIGSLTQSGTGMNQEGMMGAMPTNMFP